jgi:mono/diheme cytochrome c family protein
MKRLRAMPRGRRFVVMVVIGAVAAFLLAQAVPYGRDHSDPPVTQALKFDSARTEALFAGACGDCHSNRTEWPWYTNIAPFSWLIQRDVDEGRGVLNVSEWNKPQPERGDITEQISSGEMPPWQYTPLHSAADLSAAGKRDLIAGLTRSYQADPPAATGGGGG